MLLISHAACGGPPASKVDGFLRNNECKTIRVSVQLICSAAYTRSVHTPDIGCGGKERDETREIRSLNNARAARACKGKAADLGFKPTSVTRVE